MPFFDAEQQSVYIGNAKIDCAELETDPAFFAILGQAMKAMHDDVEFVIPYRQSYKPVGECPHSIEWLFTELLKEGIHTGVRVIVPYGDGTVSADIWIEKHPHKLEYKTLDDMMFPIITLQELGAPPVWLQINMFRQQMRVLRTNKRIILPKEDTAIRRVITRRR